MIIEFLTHSPFIIITFPSDDNCIIITVLTAHILGFAGHDNREGGVQDLHSHHDIVYVTSINLFEIIFSFFPERF